MRAEDFFEMVRDASRDMDRITRTIERMKSREDVGGASLGPMSHGSASDPMGRVNVRLDFERHQAEVLTEARTTIDQAVALLFGHDGRTGLAMALGNQYAEMLWLRYLDLNSLQTVAVLYETSRQTIRRRIDLAFDFIDSNGYDNTARGINTLN